MRLLKQLEVLSLIILLSVFAVGKEKQISAEQRNIDKNLKVAPPPNFVEMEPFTVSVIKNGSTVAYLRIEITLEAHDEEGSEIIQYILPNVRDAVLVDLHGAMSNLWITGNEPPMSALKKRIEQIIEQKLFSTGEYAINGKLINRDMIKAVHIKNIAMQHVNG